MASFSKLDGSKALACRLLVEHPEWSYPSIVAIVNGTIDGASVTVQTLRWYSCHMRTTGIHVKRLRKRDQVVPGENVGQRTALLAASTSS